MNELGIDDISKYLIHVFHDHSKKMLSDISQKYSINKEELFENREEELRGAIDLHGQHPSTNDERNMLKSILDLDEITAGSIMVPRKDIYSLPSNILSEYRLFKYIE